MEQSQPEKLYYIDKIRILSSKKIKELREIFNHQELGKHCSNLTMGRASKTAMEFGYRSRLEASVPTDSFFMVLMDLDPKLKLTLREINHQYAVSYIEIAADQICSSRLDAINKAEKLGKGTRMKWAKERYLYDAIEFGESPKYKPSPDNIVYGPYTFHESSKNCEYVIYSRDSKINKKPAVHSEFKLKNSGTIQKELRIYCLGDLINYDVKTFHESFYKKRISNVNDIDYEKLAKWQLGLSRLKDLSEEQKKKIRVRVNYMKHDKYFENGSTMLKFYHEMNKQIKSEIGPPTEYQQRVLRTNFYRFLKPSDLE